MNSSPNNSRLSNSSLKPDGKSKAPELTAASRSTVKQQKTDAAKQAPAAESASAINAPLETAFRFDAPHAHEVLLAGDFTQWNKSPLKLVKGGGGVWHAKLVLKPGSYQYRFLVDGQWQNDPHTKKHVGNPFGSENAVIDIF